MCGKDEKEGGIMAELPEGNEERTESAVDTRSENAIARFVLGILRIGCLTFGCLCVLLFAIIAIPGACRSRIQSNESAAIGNLRTITGAQTGYDKAHGVYAGSFAELTDATHGPAYLLGQWGEGVAKTGYILKLKSTDNGNCYEANADPATPGRTGIRHFFTDCSGVIRWNVDGPAHSTSPPIGE